MIITLSALCYPASLISGIRGAVNVDGSGGGADTVDVYNTSDTVGRTLHIGDNASLARRPAITSSAPAVSALCRRRRNDDGPSGLGRDTVYAAPDAFTPITITAANPDHAARRYAQPDLATAQNYVVNGTPANGNVTSTNLKTLSYTGFETGPNISDANFDGDGDVDGADFLAWQRGLGKPDA